MRKFNLHVYFGFSKILRNEFGSISKMDFFWIYFDRGNQNSGWNSAPATGGWNNYEGYGEHGAHSQPIGQQIAYTGHKAVLR